MTEFQIPERYDEQLWLISVQQITAPDNFRNDLLSRGGWSWQGNVVVVHECGLEDCCVLEWISANLDAVRFLLTHEVGNGYIADEN